MTSGGQNPVHDDDLIKVLTEHISNLQIEIAALRVEVGKLQDQVSTLVAEDQRRKAQRGVLCLTVASVAALIGFAADHLFEFLKALHK